MKRYINTVAAALVAAGMFASLAQAGSIRIIQVPNGGGTDNSPSNLAGTVTNDVLIDAGPTEQIGAIQIYSTITDSGSFFQHGFGNNLPPNAALIPAFPNLAFDTFVASGQPVGTAFSPTVAGASATLGSPGTGGPVVFTNKTVDITYGPQAGQVTLGAIGWLAGRFTIGSEGTFKIDVEFSGNGPHASNTYTIHNGIIGVPEPASLTLVGLAMFGVVGFIRRRS